MTNCINGRIIDDSGNGIKNLVIVFYDTDKKFEIPNNLKVNVFTYLEDQGSDRLGSTYSKDDGSFDFSFDYQDFAPDKEEERPDILVLVLTPDIEGKSEVLSFSELSIKNASRSEAILIKLDSEKTKMDVVDTPKKTGMIEDIAKDKKLISELNSTASEFVLEQFDRVEKINKEDIFKDFHFTSFPKKMVADPLYLKNLSSLREKQNLAISNKAHQIFDQSKQSSTFSIGLTDGDISVLKLEQNEIEKLKKGGTINISYDKYCQLTNKKLNGKILIKSNDIRDILNKISLTSQSSNSEDEYVEIPADNSKIGGQSSDDFVKNQVKEIYENKIELSQHLESYNSIKNDINIDLIEKSNVESNNENLIDQKAIHDFEHLQIAFENVWTEAFDRTLEDKVKSLYKSLADIVYAYNQPDGLGQDLFDRRIQQEYLKVRELLQQEVTDFNKIVAALNNSVEIVGKGIPIPSTLSNYSIKQKDWERLSIKQQNEIYKIHEKTRDKYDSLSVNEKIEYLKSITEENWVSILKKYRLHDESTLESLWGSRYQERSSTLLEAVINNPQFYNLTFKKYASELSLHQLLEGPDVIRASSSWVRLSKSGLDFTLEEYFDFLSKEQALKLINNILSNPNGHISTVTRLIEDINKRLLEPYSFRVFAPNSVNYGIITTYRQTWDPLNWQVGDLIATIPLAPGEKRKYNKKTKVKKTRSRKEIEKNIISHTDEASYISKAHSEIIGKTKSATNFNSTIEGSYGVQVGVQASLKNTTAFRADQGTESARTKKSIRESTNKAKNEYKNERHVEITSSELFDIEETSSGEITNPNNEISVTYLFYELERQYKISEELRQLTPVILVAFDVPAPHDIDEDWLLSHEWILRRILLDDSFNEAFDYLREGLIGDQINLEAAKGYYEKQSDIVENIAMNVDSLSLLKATLQENLNQATDNKILNEFNNRRRDRQSTFNLVKGLFNPFELPSAAIRKAGSDANATGFDAEYFEAEREAFESRLNTTSDEFKGALSELANEQTVLEKAKNQLMMLTDKIYTKRNLINQLRIHVKQNILYYMQGIWSHEPPDQRFFRLYDRLAPTIVSATETIPMRAITQSDLLRNSIYESLGLGMPVDFSYTQPSAEISYDKKLHEVADLDNLLGFKGNYAIFPLRKCTYITDFMMKDYVNDYLGIRDPDTGFEQKELIQVHDYLEKIETPTDKQSQLLKQLKGLITHNFTQKNTEDDVIAIPSGQIYIEALPGKHALLEDFKLKHRAMDVLKVQEEVKEAKIENLRKSARILNKDYEDSDIDKMIKVDGIQDININE